MRSSEENHCSLTSRRASSASSSVLSLDRCSTRVHPGGGPKKDPGHARRTRTWLALRSCRMSWKRRLWPRRSGCLCLDRCPETGLWMPNTIASLSLSSPNKELLCQRFLDTGCAWTCRGQVELEKMLLLDGTLSIPALDRLSPGLHGEFSFGFCNKSCLFLDSPELYSFFFLADFFQYFDQGFSVMRPIDRRTATG